MAVIRFIIGAIFLIVAFLLTASVISSAIGKLQYHGTIPDAELIPHAGLFLISMFLFFISYKIFPFKKRSGSFFNAYSISEKESTIDYQYKAIYSYLTPTLLILFFLATISGSIILIIIALFYMIFVLFVGISTSKTNRIIKRAMKEGAVQLQGSKWSFSQPLTCIVKRSNIIS